MEVRDDQLHAPTALTPRKEPRHTLVRRLGGPHCRSEQVDKKRTVVRVPWSVYRQLYQHPKYSDISGIGSSVARICSLFAPTSVAIYYSSIPGMNEFHNFFHVTGRYWF
jgi:hypothetical protein